MASNLGSLTVDVIAKVGAFVDGLSKAERESKKFRAGVEKNLKAAGTAFVALGIAGAAATAALIKSSIDTADAMSKQSQIIGVNIEDLSALNYAAGLADVSFEQLGSGLGIFSKTARDAFEGVGIGADAFRQLQIDVKNTDGTLKGTGELVTEIAGRFAAMPDGILKTALAQDLFGKSGAKMIPLLNAGAQGLKAAREEAERYGLVISAETGKAAEEFNDNLTRLKAVVSGTGLELSAALLPQMVEFTDLIKDPKVQEGIKAIVTGIADMAIAAAKFVGEIPDMIGFMRELTGFGNDNFAGLLKQLDDVQRKIAKFDPEDRSGEFFENLRKEEEELLAAIKRVEDAYVARQNAPPPAVITPPAFEPLPGKGTAAAESKEAAEAAKEWERQMEEALDAAEKSIQALQEIEDARVAMNAGMERELALYGETSQAAILRYDIEHGALAALSEENKAYSIALAEQLDLKKQLAEEAANDEQFEATAAGLQKQIDLLGNTSRAAELLYDIEHGGYDQFRQDQQDKLLLLVQELEAREQVQQEIEEAAKAQQKIMDDLVENTQNILADFLKGSFDDGLKGAVDRFKQMLADMAAEAVAADIMKYVVGSFGGNKTGSNTGSTVGSVISAFAGLFDSGGNIGSGQWGIVGEMGPEIVRGPAHVTSREDTAAMMGGNSMNFGNININLPGVTNRNEGSQAGVSAAREFLSTLQFANRRR